MTWFGAHIIVQNKRIDNIGNIYVYENIILIEAVNFKEAEIKANIIAKDSEVDDPTFTIDGFPAVSKFIGIRKVVSISNPTDSNLDQDKDEPISGTEITYSEYILDSEEDLENLINNKDIIIKYIGVNV